MMRRIYIALGLLTLLTGCATPEQIAAARQRQEDIDAETCASYGLRPGSENFGMCMLQLDLAREQRYYDYNYRYSYGYRHHPSWHYFALHR